jgi:hypothetical protein
VPTFDPGTFGSGAFDAGTASSSTITVASFGTPMDHVSLALGRLPEQFKNQPNIAAWLTAILQPAVTLETTLWSLYTSRWLPTASGAQLDVIGKVVGLPRNGLSDATYQQYLRVQIATNRSGGLVEDLINIAVLTMADPSIHVTIVPYTYAFVEVVLSGNVVGNDSANALITFLSAAVAAGVRVVLRSQMDTDANTFMTPISAFSPGAISIGQATVTVDTTTGFSTSGTLTIESDTVTYTGTTATTFQNCAGIVSSHSAGVQVDNATQPGAGFGDANEKDQPQTLPYLNVNNTGGRLSDARASILSIPTAIADEFYHQAQGVIRIPIPGPGPSIYLRLPWATNPDTDEALL